MVIVGLPGIHGLARRDQNLKDSPEDAVAESFSASVVSDITPTVRKPISESASPVEPGAVDDPAKAVEYDANPRDRRDLVNRPSAAPIELVQSRYAALIFTHTGTHAN